MPGHRGLARSTSSIGTRIPWTAVKEIRQTLLPDDSRFTPLTVGLKDNKVFAMQGIPMGARDSEVARFCKDIGWAAIPMRRIPQRSSTTWWCTAEQGPKVPAAKWFDSTVLISEVPDEQRFKPRGGEGRRDVRKGKDESESKAASSGAHEQHPAGDKLTVNDPWANYSSKAASSSGAASQGHRPVSAISLDLSPDPRLSALTARLDAVESDHKKLNAKVDGIDGKLSTLNTSIADQFQNVMAGLAKLQEKQDDEAKRARVS